MIIGMLIGIMLMCTGLIMMAIGHTKRPTGMFPLKDDRRPPRVGWAPGRYMNQCVHCKRGFLGDKRAVHCADCAYSFE